MKRQRNLPLERPPSLGDIAVDAIRTAIIRGKFSLGASLSEAALSEMLGISKTPIREAISVLKQEGLVTVIPQRGAFVFSLTPDQNRQLCRYRLTLEVTALTLAIKENSRRLLEALDRICGEMQAALRNRDFDLYIDLDNEYHAEFFVWCGNEYLQNGYRSVSGKVSTLRTHLSRAPKRTETSMAEHLEIARLLGEGKLGKAKTVLKRQITRGERVYFELTGEPSVQAATSPKRE